MLEVIEDLPDHLGVFDAGNHLHSAGAFDYRTNDSRRLMRYTHCMALLGQAKPAHLGSAQHCLIA